MTDKVKIKTTAPMLIAGEHVDAGSTIEVDVGLANRLVGSERAVPAEEKAESDLPPGVDGKQNKAKGLTTDGAGAGLVKR